MGFIKVQGSAGLCWTIPFAQVIWAKTFKISNKDFKDTGRLQAKKFVFAFWI